MSIRRHRAEVLLIVVLFAVPLITALTMRLVGWTPDATENHGRFLEEPVKLPVDDERLTDYWTLVFEPRRPCGADCRQAFDGLLRVQRGLGRDAHRLRLAHAGPVDGPVPADAALDVAGAAWLDELNAEVPNGRQANAAYLLDPRGFLVLWYPPGFEPSGVLEDVDRLLRYSRVGVQ